MSCAACERAQTVPLTGRASAGCFGCETRAIAHQIAYFEATRADRITDAYRNVLRAAFGDRWKEAHASVKAWAEKINAATRAEPNDIK